MLAQIILSGILIGLPARVISIDTESNAVIVQYARPDLKMRAYSVCSVAELKQRKTLHFSQIRIRNGRIEAFAKECAI